MVKILRRFWVKVAQAGNVCECWLWLAGLTHNGYGKFRAGGDIVRAHRFAYEQTIGPIPDGLELDHACRVRACVNPWHLEPVTSGENTRRGVAARAAA